MEEFFNLLRNLEQYQSINQSINQPTICFINQITNAERSNKKTDFQQINQSINQFISVAVYLFISLQCIKQSINQSINQSTNQITQLIIKSINKSVSQPFNSINQWFSNAILADAMILSPESLPSCTGLGSDSVYERMQ